MISFASYWSSRSAVRSGDFALEKPIRAWVPSQYGLRFDPPHRHSATMGRTRRVSPLELVSFRKLRTMYGPFGSGLIVVRALRSAASERIVIANRGGINGARCSA